MNAFSVDADTLTAIAAGIIALAALVLAIRTLRAGKIFRGGVWLAVSAAALISYFFATFSIRLF